MNYDVLFSTNVEDLDTHNNNVDVCIRCENGTEYITVVIAPDNQSTLMKKHASHSSCQTLDFLLSRR